MLTTRPPKPLKGPVHSKLNCALELCKNKLHEKLNLMSSITAQVSRPVCHFFVNSVCLLVCVTMVDENKVVVCCFLATSSLMISEKKKIKRKIWSKKWYLKSNISRDTEKNVGFLD
jgi:hypothetical protein